MAKFVTMAGWSDIPHLDEKTKKTLLDSIPPYQRDARSKGIPQLGAGAIYPVPESEVVVKDFQIPPHFVRGYGLDVGWNKTAAIFGALDRETDILYLYSEHYKGEAEPVIHARAIQARGKWMPGRIDPAARGRGQRDGEQILQDYIDLGLNVGIAINAVESGIYKVWERLSTGRLKVFGSLENWLAEFRIYRRDEKGKIVKNFDHLMDSCLHPDTEVITSNGVESIASLVGKEGYVLSRCGAWLKYVGARRTIEGARVIELVFDDGTKVTCTPDHPFLTKSGWIRADEMKGKSCYNGVTQRNQGQSWNPLSFLKQFKNSITLGITYAVNTFSVAVLGCTARYTNTTMERYLKESIFIIKMRIKLIILAVTCRQLAQKIISGYIIKESINLYQRMQLILLSYGTNLLMVGTGIKGTIRSRLRYLGDNVSSSVNSAEGNTAQQRLEPIDFVQIPVKQSLGKHPVLMMRNVIVWFAVAIMWRISIFPRKHAREAALVSCHTIREKGISDVYCLTVPGASAFCIESGLVVHNTRYLVQECERTSFMKAKPTRRSAITTSVEYYN